MTAPPPSVEAVLSSHIQKMAEQRTVALSQTSELCKLNMATILASSTENLETRKAGLEALRAAVEGRRV